MGSCDCYKAASVQSAENQIMRSSKNEQKGQKREGAFEISYYIPVVQQCKQYEDEVSCLNSAYLS